MTYFIIPLCYLLLLTFDWTSSRKHISKKERVLYLFLATLALLSSFFAAYRAQSDHVGASLSGMLSLFIS